jgi:predicted enzyme related to lactoylglutathione lyase
MENYLLIICNLPVRGAPMSKRNIVHIEIPAADTTAAAQFYQTIFGWKTTRDEAMNYTM